MLPTWAALRAGKAKQQISKAAVLKRTAEKEEEKEVVQLWGCSYVRGRVFVWCAELVRKGWPAWLWLRQAVNAVLGANYLILISVASKQLAS
jgi:hypothetical protein